MKRNKAEDQGLDISVDLPKDAVWRLLGKVISDLDVCSLDHKLHSAIRGRDVVKLLESISRYDARSIIERLGHNLASVSTFGKLYQVGALIKKYPFPGQDTFSPAYKKFLQCEEQCRLFNTQNYRALIKLSSGHPKYYGLLNDLRKEIYALIGDAPDLDRVYALGKHGPGQTAGGAFKDGCVTSFYKFTNLPYSVSANARTHAIACIEKDPRWIGGLMDFYRERFNIPKWSPINMEQFWNEVLVTVDASEITSVPKTALIDRFIAMEPTLNVFLQLGVDGVLRQMLRDSWGFDLNDQGKNQELAKEGSLTNSLATLDLAGASDTVSIIIVLLLFPPQWISLLLDLRMQTGVVKKTGDVVKFSKLSSMGNGFTFAIESVIFGACTRVAMRRTGSHGKSAVYGDDIICPSKAAPFLVEILNLCGFEINSEKSFIQGPFRESCGKDYFLGCDVRPIFITDKFANVPSLFHLYNSLLLKERVWEWPYGHTFEQSKKLLLSWIPPDLRANCRGPYSDSTNTHLFTEERLPRNNRGYCYHWKLEEKAVICRIPRKLGYQTFHLRKLMVRFREQSDTEELTFLGFPIDSPIDKWDWRKKLARGNAFDITRRKITYHKLVRSYVASWPLTPTR